jgi:hypothetical protein
MNNKQTFCWHCGKKLKLPYFSEITDPIGNTHKVHKVCKNDAKESFRAMDREISHTSNGLDVIQLMDHII